MRLKQLREVGEYIEEDYALIVVVDRRDESSLSVAMRPMVPVILSQP